MQRMGKSQNPDSPLLTWANRLLHYGHAPQMPFVSRGTMGNPGSFSMDVPENAREERRGVLAERAVVLRCL